MSPASFTPEKECYSVLILQFFRKADIKDRLVSDTLGTTEAGRSPSEELVEIQTLSVDLREAVMACLCGQESRRWTIAELVERFKNLGVCASRASVTAALAELGVELELSGWAPWRLLERGTEWILEPKSELVALLSGVRRLPLKEAKILSEEHKAVLLVTIGYRQKGGVSKRRVGEILGLDASSYLDDLLSQGLIYSDPSRELKFWRPTQSALLALGLRSHTDIPALKELEEWFDTQKEMRAIAKLDPFFERTSRLASRRLKREIERRGTLGEFALEPDPSLTRIPTEEGGSDLFRSDRLDAAAAFSYHGESPQSVVQGCPAQGSAVGPWKKES
jgi:chromosome segregation and condensation protein ScpB